jgi:hypothetical protein
MEGKKAISVVAGWNLVGSISSPVSANNIIPINTTIQTPFYEYRAGYQGAAVLAPGKGYSVKVSGAGKIVLVGE